MSDSLASVASYGDVTAEYQALHHGVGLVRGHRSLAWVRGSDAVSFLDGQLSQDVAAMRPGTVARSFLLEPRGKLVALLWVLRGDQEVGLITGSARVAETVEALNRFRFRVAATIEDPVPLIELWGPTATTVLAAAGFTVPPGEWVDDGSVLVASVSETPRIVVVAGLSDAALVTAGAVPVGSLASTTVRIEWGEPVMGVDVDEATIPQESGLVDRSVSFTKGCYVGQELVARIDSRGRVNRHLRGLTITENVIPPVGAAVELGDEVVGTVTSVGESLVLRAPIALAMLRREAEPGSGVTVRWETGHTTAIVRELPMVADGLAQPT